MVWEIHPPLLGETECFIIYDVCRGANNSSILFKGWIFISSSAANIKVSMSLSISVTAVVYSPMKGSTSKFPTKTDLKSEGNLVFLIKEDNMFWLFRWYSLPESLL